jgi:hypothetical protein
MKARQGARVALFGLAVLLAPVVAGAEPIPQEYLDADYQNCMQQSESTSYTEAQRQNYCRCSTDEIAKLEFDQYLQLTGEVLENNPSPETAAFLEGVGAACGKHLTQ